MATVRGFENAAARQNKSAVFAHKVDVVDGVGGAEPPLNPTLARIVRVSQESSITAHPASFRADKIDRIQVLSAGTNARADPAALGRRRYRCAQCGDDKNQLTQSESHIICAESVAQERRINKRRNSLFAAHNSRKRGLRAATIETKIAMIKPPAASVLCTPNRCEAAPAIRFPIGIAPMNESMNMLITRPRISSVTSFCKSVFVTATEQTMPKPRAKRKKSDSFKFVDSEKQIRQTAKAKSPPSTNHPLRRKSPRYARNSAPNSAPAPAIPISTANPVSPK